MKQNYSGNGTTQRNESINGKIDQSTLLSRGGTHLRKEELIKGKRDKEQELYFNRQIQSDSRTDCRLNRSRDATDQWYTRIDQGTEPLREQNRSRERTINRLAELISESRTDPGTQLINYNLQIMIYEFLLLIPPSQTPFFTAFMISCSTGNRLY